MSATRHVYATKAEKYARYRWDYAPAAIQRLWEITGLNSQATVADVGAGTGILTRHFAGRVRRVCAFEPNLEMRALAAVNLAASPGCLVAGAAAEALPLPNCCIDLLAAGQAVHWFEPEPARAEFRRVLKPDGWLAFISNRGSDPALGAALAGLQTVENGVHVDLPAAPGLHTPPAFYMSANQQFSFPFSLSQDWESFIGSMLSASFMPGEDHPAYPSLERAARQVFTRFSRAGWLEVKGITDLWIGRIG
jgi:SAM-dependent methyltransferase